MEIVGKAVLSIMVVAVMALLMGVTFQGMFIQKTERILIETNVGNIVNATFVNSEID